ncbi:matrixin family metalloprotease [Tunturiibacter gelidiferens]|uniref:matrixin family metalloprotease n=1 Tax=Tunturiibacter gelidiferens TaxID=3069689 RepID=UPI003D9B74F6
MDLQVVLLHELGHWAGIAFHPTTPKNIMYEYINYAQCIDNADVNSLASATNVGMPGKAMALRYLRNIPKGSATR